MLHAIVASMPFPAKLRRMLQTTAVRPIDRLVLRVRPPLDAVEAVAALGLVAIEAGLGQGEPRAARVLAASATGILVCTVARFALTAVREPRRLRRSGTIIGAAAVLAGAFVSLRLAAGLALVVDALRFAAWVRRTSVAGRALADVLRKPARALTVSFLALIAFGTVLLSLPAAAAGPPVAVIDAFFTSVSATCVTGLASVDTATVWSPFGLGVIVALVQLGGIGVMVATGAMALAFGESLGARRNLALRDVFDESDAQELKSLLKTVLWSTFAIELTGAIFLFWRFAGEMPLGRAASYAVFHAVSGFCNAGFALWSDNLVRYSGETLVPLVIAGLLIAGGIGYPVLVELWRVVRTRGRHLLPVHAKVVLATSAALLWIGTLFYFFFEYDRSLASLDLPHKLVHAFFQSATPRTAGFNTVPLGGLHPLTVFMMIVLMFIGASPSSTGGGIKTTTFAVVFLAVRAFMFERADAEAFGRRIPQAQVLRALALTGGAAATFAVGFGCLLVLEPQPFYKLAFETASALGTVGLSLDLTPLVSSPSKLVLCALMFIGRVGPLTAVVALAARKPTPARVVLPEGKVLVG
jgi:trk system potassium uptake protein